MAFPFKSFKKMQDKYPKAKFIPHHSTTTCLLSMINGRFGTGPILEQILFQTTTNNYEN